jgi:hypothetical protein
MVVYSRSAESYENAQAKDSMAKRKSSKELSGGCLSLFGLPFLVAGLFMSGIYFSGLAKWWSARNWEEVPCWIESAELKVGRGDDSDTYEATASYRYIYQGRSHHGDQVSFHGGKDNIGRFQQKAHRELSSHLGEKPAGAEADPQQDTAVPFRCYVNPEDPSESVLYRTLRWEMQAFMAIFALTFPAVGAGLVAGGIVSSLALRKEAALREIHPGEPWKWSAQWTGNTIPENATKWRAALYFYTLWSGIIVFTLIASALISGAFQSNGMAWVLMIFVILWCIPAWFSIKRFRHRLAVGGVRFEPREMPAWPGGVMEGAILLQRPPPMRLPAEIDLVCEKSITRKTGDGDSTSTEKIWSHRETVSPDAVSRDLSGFRLPVKFTLPADAPETGAANTPDTKHTWKLHFKVPGTAIDSAFELPVFRTEKSPALSEASSSAAPSILDDASTDLPALLAARRIRAEFDTGGAPLSIICPPARNRSMIVFFIIFDLIWTAAAVFLVLEEAPLLFRIVWPVSAAAIWAVVIWSLLHKRSVTFDSAGVNVRNQLGPVIWTQGFEKPQITGFSHDTNMSSGNINFYRVRLESVIGKKKTLVDGITESTTAAALVKRLEEWKSSR